MTATDLLERKVLFRDADWSEEAAPDLTRVAGAPGRLDIDPERLEKDLARLVLTLVELLRRLMEAQAVNRLDRGTLSDEEAERVGTALMAARDKLDELREVFGLAPEDLNLDLGPLGSLL